MPHSRSVSQENGRSTLTTVAGSTEALTGLVVTLAGSSIEDNLAPQEGDLVHKADAAEGNDAGDAATARNTLPPETHAVSFFLFGN